MHPVSRSLRLWLVVFCFCLGPLPFGLAMEDQSLTGAAWADDDDDDGGDDDDDDGDDGDDDAGGGGDASGGGQGSGSGGSASGGDSSAARGDKAAPPARGRDPVRPRAQKPPPPQARALPEFAAEIVVSDLTQADLDLLLAEGFSLIERRQITTLGLTLDRLSPPRGQSLRAARDRVRALDSGRDADLNHYYRSSAGCDHENCPAWALVSWPDTPFAMTPAVGAGPSAVACGSPVPIGLIDTGINPDHEVLRGADVMVLPLAAGGASGAVHGTAVLSVLVGQPGSRVPGLLPRARVLAVDVFRKDRGDERADVADLVEGMDILAQRGVRLFSMSLAGPQNAVLTRMLDRLTDPALSDSVVVAAMGNGGPKASPAWPAAHPRVLAVTAVDPRGRIYPQAQRGDHVDLAAPGVGLLAATSVRGARGKTGTSFAVPFVTAAAALLLGGRGPGGGDTAPTGAAVRAALTAAVTDLGAAGPDPVFGQGVLAMDKLCDG